MKIKYLFPVLAGMAMTACNSEDDLALNSANDLKTSPITFTFTEESPLSRATVGDGQSVVKFEQGDLTSLFNGLGALSLMTIALNFSSRLPVWCMREML